MKAQALVTGASGGIGLEIAKALASRGYDLILVDIRADGLDAATRMIESKWPGISVACIEQDLALPEAASQLFQHPVLQAAAPLAVLVNNAGFGLAGYFSETDWTREQQMIQLHVATLTHFTKLVLPGMLARSHGKILNVGSVASFFPGPLMAVYYATKAYVRSFSEALANELKGSGVSVTLLCPGQTATGFQSGTGAVTPNKLIQRFTANSEEVARVAVEGMEKGKSLVIPGISNALFVTLRRFLPRSLLAQAVRNIQERNRRFLRQAAQPEPQRMR